MFVTQLVLGGRDKVVVRMASLPVVVDERFHHRVVMVVADGLEQRCQAGGADLVGAYQEVNRTPRSA